MMSKFLTTWLLLGVVFFPGLDLQIRQFVKTELTNYPEARLTDLYKNYFQDSFGPGHLIPDTLSAGRYLDWELRQNDYTDTVKFQELGIRHDFIRVNLVLVKKGVIPRNVMLEAMASSARLARKPGMESWRKEWHETVSLIRETEPDLPDFAEDSLKIEKVLDSGEVAMHHSARFSEKYHPHYRIIHHSVFELWKKSYLKEYFK